MNLASEEPSGRFHVREAGPEDGPGIVSLFNTVFAEGHDRFEPRTEEQWRWEYLDNPAGTQIAVAEAADGEIIAHYACLPVEVNVQGQQALAGQGVDSMVHPDWRRGLKKQGPFLAVAEEYFRRWGNARLCHFGFGYPNRRAFRIGVKLLGYDPIVKPVPTLYRNFFEAADDDEVGRAFADAAEVVAVDSFGEEFDELWEGLREHHPFALIRSSRYLQWRYLDPPHLRYRCWAIRDDGGLRAFFVTRAGWQGLPILGLVDFLAAPDDEAALGLALRQALRDARESEQVRVEAWFPEPSWTFAATLRQGFSTERCQYVLCCKNYRDSPDLDWVKRNWYYTIGDSDVF